ncbi:hypothetical protein TNCV_3599791 [Trichonephila clavipes]|nr:hypothetical protein TNCV_3599791 [Trichonephila clavipes]
MDSRFWRSGPRQDRGIDSGGLHSWPVMARVQKLTQKVCPRFIVSSHLHLRRDALAGGGEQSQDLRRGDEPPLETDALGLCPVGPRLKTFLFEDIIEYL